MFLIGKKIHGVLIFVSMVDTIVVGFAKYASYCGLILMDRGIPCNPRKFMHLENFYTYSISTSKLKIVNFKKEIGIERYIQLIIV